MSTSTSGATPAGVRFDVIAAGLANPRGLAFGPGNDLYILETGVGPQNGLSPNGPVVSFLPNYIAMQPGLTASITRLDLQNRDRTVEIVDGLPSLLEYYVDNLEPRILSAGSNDLTITRNGDIYVVVGSGLTDDSKAAIGENSKLFGTILKIEGVFDNRPGETVTPLFDFVANETANNPDGSTRFLGDVTTPYAVRQYQGMLVVADSGGNAVHFLTADGKSLIKTVVLPTQQLPPNPDGTPGAVVEAVPTSVTIGPDGALYVGELTGIPYTDGIARIWRFTGPNDPPQVHASGFSQIIDIEFDGRGNLFVLEYANAGTVYDRSIPVDQLATSRLWRVEPDGDRTLISGEELEIANGLLVDPRGDVFVAINGGGLEDGQVIRYDLDGIAYNNGRAVPAYPGHRANEYDGYADEGGYAFAHERPADAGHDYFMV